MIFLLLVSAAHHFPEEDEVRQTTIHWPLIFIATVSWLQSDQNRTLSDGQVPWAKTHLRLWKHPEVAPLNSYLLSTNYMFSIILGARDMGK